MIYFFLNLFFILLFIYETFFSCSNIELNEKSQLKLSVVFGYKVLKQNQHQPSFTMQQPYVSGRTRI